MDTKQPLLPVFATIEQSYGLAWQHRRDYWQIARWWVLLTLPFYFIFNWLTWSEMEAVLCPQPGHEIVNATSSLVVGAIHALTFILVGASIAVAWHRLVLRGEPVPSGRYLGYGPLVKTYALFGFYLFLMSEIPLFVMSTASRDLDGVYAAIVFGVFLSMFVILFYMVRIMVKLPAIAVENEEATVMEVLRRTRWNFWRLLWGMVFTVAPSIVVSMFVPLVCTGNMKGAVYYTIMHYTYLIVVMPIMLSFLSLSYQFFFERGTKDEGAAD